MRVIRARDDEARENLKKVVKIMLKDLTTLPTIEFRMITCRLLVELMEFKESIRVLDTIVQENDEQPEAWYLLAFSYFHLKKYQNAKECCKNVKTMMTKLKLKDEELKAGSEELMTSILKSLGKSSMAGIDEENNENDDEMADEGDSFETLSQEDISEDEEMRD